MDLKVFGYYSAILLSVLTPLKGTKLDVLITPGFKPRIFDKEKDASLLEAENSGYMQRGVLPQQGLELEMRYLWEKYNAFINKNMIKESEQLPVAEDSKDRSSRKARHNARIKNSALLHIRNEGKHYVQVGLPLTDKLL
jgi:hypothetical protein